MIDSEEQQGIIQEVFSKLRDEGFTITNRPTNARRSASKPARKNSKPCACDEVDVGQVLSEDQVQKVGRDEGKTLLTIPSSTLVTPLAKERANDLNVEIRRE